jgi:hypothetical protein
MAIFSKPRSLRQSIVWTVAYTDQFSFPLTEIEIWERLVCCGNWSKAKFKEELDGLVRGNLLLFDGGFYALSLPGRNKFFGLRKQRKITSHQKWPQVNQLVKLISWWPGIESLWVTGSLAMLNSGADNDVDFMVVTWGGWLWMTRLLLTFLVWLAGKKRVPNGKERRTWCFNLWLDTKHLKMPLEKQSPFTAYEVIQAKMIFARNQKKNLFAEANGWVKEWLPHWQVVQATRSLNSKPGRASAQQNLLEFICYHFQLAYMQRHRTSEQIAPGYAFFHPRETGELIQRRWKQTINKIKSS